MLRHDSKSYNSTSLRNLRFVVHGKQVCGSGVGGYRGFPALLKGDDPILHPIFWEITFFGRERRSPQNVREILQILAWSMVGSSGCSSIFFLFYSNPPTPFTHTRIHTRTMMIQKLEKSLKRYLLVIIGEMYCTCGKHVEWEFTHLKQYASEMTLDANIYLLIPWKKRLCNYEQKEAFGNIK